MITRITGVLNRVLDEEVRLQVGAFEYQVLVAEFVRRTVQGQVGEELTFHTIHYFDGNPMQGKVVPRLVGFLHETDTGVLRAVLHRGQDRHAEGAQGAGPADQGSRRRHPAAGRQVADDAARRRRADGRQDRRHPQRKVTRFALRPVPGRPRPAVNGGPEPMPAADHRRRRAGRRLPALMALGHSPIEARDSPRQAARHRQDVTRSAEEILIARSTRQS